MARLVHFAINIEMEAENTVIINTRLSFIERKE